MRQKTHEVLRKVFKSLLNTKDYAVSPGYCSAASAVRVCEPWRGGAGGAGPDLSHRTAGHPV